MWEGVRVKCADIYGMVQSAASIRLFWKYVTRMCQHWLAPKGLVCTHVDRLSGCYSESAYTIREPQNCFRRKVKVRGANAVDPPEFIFFTVERYLAEQLKL